MNGRFRLSLKTVAHTGVQGVMKRLLLGLALAASVMIFGGAGSQAAAATYNPVGGDFVMRDFKFRVPYGVNNSGKGSGVLPEIHTKPYPKIGRPKSLGKKRRAGTSTPRKSNTTRSFQKAELNMPWNAPRQY